jgi:cation diffusion facilitator family transporter
MLATCIRAAGYPYGFERAEDLSGIGIAIVIWISAVLAGAESINKLVRHGGTHHVGWGIAGAAVGILGNQVVARFKLRIGKQINSATLIADAKHSWLDALSSAGALLGLVGVLCGWKWADRTSRRELLDRVLDEELPRYAEALQRLGQ